MPKKKRINVATQHVKASLITERNVLETEVASAHSVFTCRDERQVQLVVGAFGTGRE